MRDFTKEFLNILEKIDYSISPSDQFSNWLILTASSLYSWKNDEKVEEEFNEIRKKLTDEQYEKYAQLFALTVEALHEKEHDFLGKIFSIGKFSNDKKAQYFTPDCVSKVNAAIMIGKKRLPKNRVCTVIDPCCGSGSMLIAAIAEMKEKNFNYQNNAFCHGIDVDARCARMTFIQLSLLGVPAVITCGNSLSKEVFWERETIGYYLSLMNFRLK